MIFILIHSIQLVSKIRTSLEFLNKLLTHTYHLARTKRSLIKYNRIRGRYGNENLPHLNVAKYINYNNMICHFVKDRPG